MLGLLARVIISVVVVGAAGAVGYGVYKLLTREKVKEEIKEKLKTQDETQYTEFLKKAMRAEIKEKEKQKLTVVVLDSLFQPLTDVTIEGDEVSDEIHAGDIISLVD